MESSMNDPQAENIQHKMKRQKIDGNKSVVTSSSADAATEHQSPSTSAGNNKRGRRGSSSGDDLDKRDIIQVKIEQHDSTSMHPALISSTQTAKKKHSDQLQFGTSAASAVSVEDDGIIPITDTYRGPIQGIADEKVKEYDENIFGDPVNRFQLTPTDVLSRMVDFKDRNLYFAKRIKRFHLLTCGEGGETKFVPVTLDYAKKIQDLGDNSAAQNIFRAVAMTGREGMWVKTMKTKLDLAPADQNRAIKKLEHSQLIQAVKLAKSKQKRYMLNFIKPPTTITGGIWFSEGSFDSELVSKMRDEVYEIVAEWEKKSSKSSDGNSRFGRTGGISVPEIRTRILDSGVFQISDDELTPEILLEIVDQLVYECKLRLAGRGPQQLTTGFKTWINGDDGDNGFGYRIEHERFVTASPVTGYSKILSMNACAHCPVRDFYADDGVISPKTCVCMDKWYGPISYSSTM